jgi:hypothetical protein
MMARPSVISQAAQLVSAGVRCSDESLVLTRRDDFVCVRRYPPVLVTMFPGTCDNVVTPSDF